MKSRQTIPFAWIILSRTALRLSVNLSRITNRFSHCDLHRGRKSGILWRTEKRFPAIP
jgi:hypothetical protein